MGVYANISSTIVKKTQDLLTVLKARGLLEATATYYSWDAHAENTTLPEHDLIGARGISYDEDGTLLSIALAIGVSTFQDENLFRLQQVIDAITETYPVGDGFPLLDATTSAELSWLLVKSVAVAPVSPSVTRPLQFVLIELASGQTAT